MDISNGTSLLCDFFFDVYYWYNFRENFKSYSAMAIYTYWHNRSFSLCNTYGRLMVSVVSMSIKWILEIIVIDVIIYFAVYGITFFQEKQFANNINKIIKTGGKTMEKIIEVKNLKKSYGDVQAVKSLSFYVESGKLFAFLGPNGAGKSTTIDIITTF